jgi:purine-nucleoside phosphorylase
VSFSLSTERQSDLPSAPLAHSLGKEVGGERSNEGASESVQQSLKAIRLKTHLVPKVGIILGSGLASLAQAIRSPTVIPYADIPHFPKLSAAGHVGELIIGHFGNTPVVVMRGRAHLYEGHSPNRATYGVRIMQALGAHILVASNAAGGLNPRFGVGELVLIDGHIDLMHRSGLASMKSKANADFLVDVPMRSGPVYDRRLMEQTSRCASRLGYSLARGTYLATLGPTYETRAEYRAFRTIGADMVGMSTVPETILAAALGMQVIAFSVITNVASPDVATTTTHDEVLDSAAMAQATLTMILQALLTELG